MKEKQINPEDVLTTYVCNKCGIYHISPFKGQEHTCVSCGSQRSVNTTNTGRGVTDAQLNEIYNLMDVYCHPFTSGGQEIPIQEAKLTELITLVTNYSCGEDSCSPESGGLPLEWSEYREPGTQFIKASTFADDIAKKLELVQSMDKEERVAREKKSRQWVIDNFSVEVIGKQLEDIIDNMPPVDYDFESKGLDYNPDYEPKENYVSHQEFLIDIYKNILCDDVDENSQGFKHWMTQLQAGKTPVDIVNYFKNVAIQEKQKIELPDLEQLLSKESGSKKIAIVIPHSDVDVFLLTLF